MTQTTYASDLTERQWHLIKDFLPPAKRGGRPRRVDLYATLNAMLSLLVTGCQWKMLPRTFPHWRTVYGYFRAWQNDGSWERVHNRLRRYARRHAAKRVRPTAASIDSQCVKSTAVAGPRGYDAFKKVKGRKRHLVVDPLGLLLVVVVTGAHVSDTAGAVQLLPLLCRCAHRLKKVWCDGGYFESAFEQAQAQHVVLEKVERPQGTKDFHLLAKRWVVERWVVERWVVERWVVERWVVERTFAWLSACRRLAREYEQTLESSQAFILLAMSKLMLNRLAPR